MSNNSSVYLEKYPSKEMVHMKIKNRDFHRRREIYFTTKIINSETEKYFVNFCEDFYKTNETSQKKLFVGMDFEFNNGNIALCQIAFFPHRKYKYIFLFDPNLMQDKSMEIFISTIMTSNVKKIVHGADSLDMPYIFSSMLKSDKSKLMDFIKHTYDTRFLCEYIKLSKGHEDKKCSLYHALLYFDVISTKQFDILIKNNSSMGPVQDVQWNVLNMDASSLKYALYDVLYLKKFILKIIENAKKHDEQVDEQVERNLHKTIAIIPQLDRLNYCEKFGITQITNVVKNKLDKMNNFMVKSFEHPMNITMIQLFNGIMNLIKKNGKTKLDELTQINNFKKLLTNLSKLITYSILMRLFEIYSDKSNKYFDNEIKNEIELNHVFKILDNLELTYLKNFLIKLKDNIYDILPKQI